MGRVGGSEEEHHKITRKNPIKYLLYVRHCIIFTILLLLLMLFH